MKMKVKGKKGPQGQEAAKCATYSHQPFVLIKIM